MSNYRKSRTSIIKRAEGREMSRSCSCTSCVYKSESDHPSVRRLLRQGSKIDKLYLGKYVPLKERNFLDRLDTTRAVYDDIRNQLLSGSSISIQEKANLKLKKPSPPRRKEIDDSEKNIVELVDMVDKGKVLEHKTKNLNNCCSCCSCGEVHARTHPSERRLRHAHGHPYGAPYSIYSGTMISRRRIRDDGRKKGARFKAKHICSDPCTCTTKIRDMLKRHSYEIIKKLRTELPKPMLEQLSDFTIDDNIKKRSRPGKILIKSYQTIMRSKTRLMQSMGEGARKIKSTIKLKEHLEAGARESKEKLKNARDKVKKSLDTAVRKSMNREKSRELPSFEETVLPIKQDSIAIFKDKLRKRRRHLYKYKPCKADCNPEKCDPQGWFRIINRRRKRRHKTEIKVPDQDQPIAAEKWEIYINKKASSKNILNFGLRNLLQIEPNETVEKQQKATTQTPVTSVNKEASNTASKKFEQEILTRSKSGNIPKYEKVIHRAQGHAKVSADIKNKPEERHVEVNELHQNAQFNKMEEKPPKVLSENRKNSLQNEKSNPIFKEKIKTAVKFKSLLPLLSSESISISLTCTKQKKQKQSPETVVKPYQKNEKQLLRKARKKYRTKKNKQGRLESEPDDNKATPQAVRISSSFSFHMEFSKENPLQRNSLEATTQNKSREKEISMIRRHQTSQTRVKKPRKYVHTGVHNLKRSFSTLKLKTKCARHKTIKSVSKNTSTQSKIYSSHNPSNLGKRKRTQTKKISQKTVICPPGMCTSKDCDSFDCYTLIKERKKKHCSSQESTESVASMFSKSLTNASFEGNISKSSDKIKKFSVQNTTVKEPIQEKTKKRKRAKRYQGSLLKRRFRHRHSQISTSTATSKYKLTKHGLQRCFCTLKLTHPKQTKTSSRKIQSSKSEVIHAHSVTSRSVSNKSKRVKSRVFLAKKINENKITRQPAKNTSSCHDRQIVKIGSTFGGNVEFYKDKESYKKSPLPPINNISDREFVMKAKRKLKTYKSSGTLRKSKLKDRSYRNIVKSQQKSTSMLLTGKNKSSLTAPVMKRCFCTLKIQPTGKREQDLNDTITVCTDTPAEEFNPKPYRESSNVRPISHLRNKRVKDTSNSSHRDTQVAQTKKGSKCTCLRPMLKRCFCTLKLHGNNQNLQTKQKSAKDRSINLKQHRIYTVSRTTVPKADLRNHKRKFVGAVSHIDDNVQRIEKLHSFVLPLDECRRFPDALSISSALINYSVIKSFVLSHYDMKSYSSYRRLPITKSRCQATVIHSNLTLPGLFNNVSEKNICSEDCLLWRKYYKTRSTSRNKINECVTSKKLCEGKLNLTGASQLLQRRYCTMNLQVSKRKKKSHKLKPCECEPEVCVPGECDPYDCQKLNIKRLMKRVSRMSGANIRSRSISSSAAPSASSSTKKIQSRQNHEMVKKSRPSRITYKALSSRQQQQKHTGKQAVRIGSSFNFNVEFSKDGSKSLSTAPPRRVAPVKSLAPACLVSRSSKIRSKKLKTKGTRGRCVTWHSQDSQSLIKTEHRGSDMQPIMKRCFCTLKLQKKGKQQNETPSIFHKGTCTPPDSSNDIVTVNVEASQNTKKPKPVNVSLYECEPQVYVPDECDPYECLERIKMRNKQTKDFGSSVTCSKKSTSSMTWCRQVLARTQSKQVAQPEIRGSKRANQRSIKSTDSRPSRIKQSSRQSRQAVRIGSNFSVNVEFFKEKSDLTSGKPQRPSLCPVKVREKNEKPQLRELKKPSFSTSGITQKNHLENRASQDFKTMRHKDSQIENLLTHASTMTATFMKHCLCTPNLHEKEKPQKPSLSKSFLQRCICLLKFKSSKKTDTAVANAFTETDNDEALPIISIKTALPNIPRHQLDPYECEPGVSTPGECNPYECEKLIKLRNMRLDSKANITDRPRTRSISTTLSKTSKARTTQSDLKPRNSGTKSRPNKTVKVKEVTRVPKPTSAPSDRQVVRIGSQFSFNIEFYKDRTFNADEVQAAAKAIKKQKTKTENKRRNLKTQEQRQKTTESGLTGVRFGCHDQESQSIKAKKKDSGVVPLLRRCFCTLKLQKPILRKVEMTTEGTETPAVSETPTLYSRGVMTQRSKRLPNVCIPCIPCECDPYECEKLIKKRLIKDSNKIVMTPNHDKLGYNLEPYECEPNICVPGKCDPYECEKIIKLRNIKLQELSTKRCKTKSISIRSTTCSKARKIQTKRLEDPNVPRKRSKSNSTKPKLRRSYAELHVMRDVSRTQPARQSVHLGSGYSFDLEFYKDKYQKNNCENLEKPKKNSQINCCTNSFIKSTINRKMQHQRAVRDTDSRIQTLLKRCFCTIKFQKSGNMTSDQSLKMENATGPKCNTINKAARDKSVYLAMFPNRMPGVCVPSCDLCPPCDPYECDKRIKRRLKHSQMSGNCGKIQKHAKASNAKPVFCDYVCAPDSCESRSSFDSTSCRVGSCFNISVDFFKNKVPQPCKPCQLPKTKVLKRNYKVQTITPKNNSTGVSPILKKCFCTSALKKNKGTSVRIKESCKPIQKEIAVCTRKHVQVLDPYECEPNFYKPDQSDPNECYERIKLRRLKESGTRTEKPIHKYTSAIPCNEPTRKGFGIQCNKQICQRAKPIHKHTLAKPCNKPTCKGFGIQCNKQICQKVAIPKKFMVEAPCKPCKPCVPTTKEVTRFGSNITFNIEFYKGLTETKPAKKTSKSKKKSTTDKQYNCSHAKNTGNSVTTATRDTGMGALLKRCFCTLNLRKDRPSNSVKERHGRKNSSIVSQRNNNKLKICKEKPAIVKTKRIKNIPNDNTKKKPMHTLEPYDCKPNVCVPGQCNKPLKCGSKINFGIEFYKKKCHIPISICPEISEVCKVHKVNKTKSTTVKNKPNTRHQAIETRVACVKMDDKAAGANNLLKRCYCTLKLQKNEAKASARCNNVITVNRLAIDDTWNNACRTKPKLQTKCSKVSQLEGETIFDNFHKTNYLIKRNCPKNLKKKKAKQFIKQHSNSLEMHTIYPYVPSNFHKNISKTILLPHENMLKYSMKKGSRDNQLDTFVKRGQTHGCTKIKRIKETKQIKKEDSRKRKFENLQNHSFNKSHNFKTLLRRMFTRIFFSSENNKYSPVCDKTQHLTIQDKSESQQDRKIKRKDISKTSQSDRPTSLKITTPKTPISLKISKLTIQGRKTSYKEETPIFQKSNTYSQFQYGDTDRKRKLLRNSEMQMSNCSQLLTSFDKYKEKSPYANNIIVQMALVPPVNDKPFQKTHCSSIGYEKRDASCKLNNFFGKCVSFFKGKNISHKIQDNDQNYIENYLDPTRKSRYAAGDPPCGLQRSSLGTGQKKRIRKEKIQTNTNTYSCCDLYIKAHPSFGDGRRDAVEKCTSRVNKTKTKDGKFKSRKNCEEAESKENTKSVKVYSKKAKKDKPKCAEFEQAESGEETESVKVKGKKAKEGKPKCKKVEAESEEDTKEVQAKYTKTKGCKTKCKRVKEDETDEDTTAIKAKVKKVKDTKMKIKGKVCTLCKAKSKDEALAVKDKGIKPKRGKPKCKHCEQTESVVDCKGVQAKDKKTKCRKTKSKRVENSETDEEAVSVKAKGKKAKRGKLKCKHCEETESEVDNKRVQPKDKKTKCRKAKGKGVEEAETDEEAVPVKTKGKKVKRGKLKCKHCGETESEKDNKRDKKIKGRNAKLLTEDLKGTKHTFKGVNDNKPKGKAEKFTTVKDKTRGEKEGKAFKSGKKFTFNKQKQKKKFVGAKITIRAKGDPTAKPHLMNKPSPNVLKKLMCTCSNQSINHTIHKPSPKVLKKVMCTCGNKICSKELSKLQAIMKRNAKIKPKSPCFCGTHVCKELTKYSLPPGMICECQKLMCTCSNQSINDPMHTPNPKVLQKLMCTCGNKVCSKCTCGNKICLKELSKLQAISKRNAKIKPKSPCFCGTHVCTKLSKYPLPPGRVCECQNAVKDYIKKSEELKLKKKDLKLRRKLKAIRDKKRNKADKRYNKQKKIEDKLKRAERLKQQKAMDRKYKMKGDLALATRSLGDILRFGVVTVSDIARFTGRAVVNPKRTARSVGMAAKHPKRAFSSIKSAVSGSALVSTARRVRGRIAAMKSIQYLKGKMAQHAALHYLININNPKKRKMFKKKKKVKVKKQIDYECNPYMSSLRKKPCIAVYYACPWFYPQCLSLLQLWRQMIEIILFLLAALVWSPFIVLVELCRALCCFFC